jgi:hypothetical protein
MTEDHVGAVAVLAGLHLDVAKRPIDQSLRRSRDTVAAS